MSKYLHDRLQCYFLVSQCVLCKTLGGGRVFGVVIGWMIHGEVEDVSSSLEFDSTVCGLYTFVVNM